MLFQYPRGDAMGTIMNPEEFREIFDDFQHRVFRLETLDFYDAENERAPLERFRAGLPQDLAWRERWRGKVEAIKIRGASISRVHIVSEPLSTYAKFEMTCAYPANVGAGEDVRVLPRAIADELGVPNEDYWLFDDDRSAAMAYDDEGRWRHVEMTDDPTTVRRHVRWRDITSAESVPLFDYLKSVGLEPDSAYDVSTKEDR
ncbi:DUF6879 family protein [Nocardiopsis sp. NPDC007018]|uniref:DUF6879 family protein n=1 Tax=Nocardiopsis sp. NPDC007018 TaxID=3155721 RepID=UPI003410427D